MKNVTGNSNGNGNDNYGYINGILNDARNDTMDAIDRSAGIPDAVAHITVVHERRQDVYLLVVDCCPLCGKTHTHGAGTNKDEIHTYLGHRSCHCFNPPYGNNGYNLILASEAK